MEQRSFFTSDYFSRNNYGVFLNLCTKEGKQKLLDRLKVFLIKYHCMEYFEQFEKIFLHDEFPIHVETIIDGELLIDYGNNGRFLSTDLDLVEAFESAVALP